MLPDVSRVNFYVKHFGGAFNVAQFDGNHQLARAIELKGNLETRV